jgi:hypothetical protein
MVAGCFVKAGTRGARIVNGLSIGENLTGAGLAGYQGLGENGSYSHGGDFLLRLVAVGLGARNVQLKQKLGELGELAPNRLAITGVDNVPFSSLAEKQYAEIRKLLMSDIDTVAKNTGLSVSDVTAMKKHLFFGKHQRFDTTTGGVIRARFEANSAVAQAWLAAQKGPLNARQKEWFRLLRDHELGERALMGQGLPFQDLSAWKLIDGEWEHVFREGLRGAHEMAPRGPKFWPFGD